LKPRVLFLVTSDPRISPRPAEAVRIAAGVGAWGKVEVSLHLRDAAVLAVGELAGELVDGDHFERYLPLVAESGRAISVQRDAPLLRELEHPRVRFDPIDDPQLAALAANSQSVVRF
jgi:hypothetical protein